MKKLFANKLNILLIILLTGCIAALGIFSYKLIFPKEKILVPDFSNSSEAEVVEWCNSFENNPCSINRDYSDSVEAGKVSYQSLAKDQELTGTISFTISKGKQVLIEALKFDKATRKEDVEKWVKDNGLTNVKYKEMQTDQYDKGAIISIEPNSITDLNTEVVVTIAIEKKTETNTNTNKEEIIINYGDYIDLSEDDFVSKLNTKGLNPVHAEVKDDYSETIEKGKVLWHGSGAYYKDEDIRYGLSLGKNEGNIIVKADEYVGKTLAEFKQICEKLGIVPKHNESKNDEFSDTVAKGSILWHGSGTYVKDENITYTLSKGKKSTDGKFEIKSGEYAGYTLDEFKSVMKALGLVVAHSEVHEDDYSNSISKGCILWHGAADDFVEGETIHYTVSLGKKEESKPEEQTGTTIKVESYAGKSESDFKAYIKGLGLSLGDRSEEYSDSISSGLIISNETGDKKSTSSIDYVVSKGKDPRIDVPSYANKKASEFESFLASKGLTGTATSEYNSTVAEGYVISNTTGKFNTGSSVSYKVSLGQKKLNISNFEIVAGAIEKSSYNETKTAAENYFKQLGFTNITVNGQSSTKTTGVILSISVDGSTNNLPGSFVSDAPIIITVCSQQQN